MNNEIPEKSENEDLPPFLMSKSGRVDKDYVGSHVIMDSELSGNRFVTMEDTKEVYYYHDGIYKPGGEDIINTYTHDMCGKYTAIMVEKEIVNYVTYHGTLIMRNNFNTPGPLLNLSNKVYNVDTGEAREHSPNDLYTYKYPVKYNPDAECPEINKFLNRILSEEDVQLIKEEIAYCFVYGQPLEKIMAWVGEGKNGKSTLLSLIDAFFGKENISNSSMQQLSDGNSSDYYQANLFGKRINMCGDMSSKSIKYLDFIKKAASSDMISCRHAYGKKTITFRNDAKMIFAMNEWPEFSDQSDGFFRKILYTEFNEIISAEERVPDYYKMLTTEEELSGFFNELMVSLRELLARGNFCKEAGVDELRASMSDTESIDVFINNKTSRVVSTTYFKNDFYKDYCEWCGDKFTPMFKSPFFKYIKTLKIKEGERKDKDGKRKRVLLDISKAAEQEPIKF